MQTEYIGPHPWERADGREVTRELRVLDTDDEGEAHPDKLTLATYGHASGQCMGAAHLPRAQAVALRDAVDRWLAEHPEEGK